MENKINCEGLSKELDFIKNIAYVLNTSTGFVITVPGGIGYEIVVPTRMEKDVRQWVHELLISELNGLSVYCFGE